MSLKPKTPAEMLRRAARWVIENADELVAGDGVYVIEDWLDLYVTIHLQSCNFTTVTVDGHTNYIVLDAADMLDENAKLRELVRDVVLLAGLNGCDVTKMQMHAHGGDWRTIWERMAELRVPGTEG